MTIDVFFSTVIRANPISQVRIAAVVLCGLWPVASVLAVLIRKRSMMLRYFFHNLTARFFKAWPCCRSENPGLWEGLNTVASPKAPELIAISLLMWFIVALAYREVAHSYPPSQEQKKQEGPPSVDVETASVSGLPEIAGQPLTSENSANRNFAAN
jgi:hypothetical protein